MARPPSRKPLTDARVNYVYLGAFAIGAIGTTYLSIAIGHVTAPSVLLGCAGATAVIAVAQMVKSLRLLLDPNAADEEARRQATGRRERELMREKQLLLKALRELEFDHDMGKLSENDYRSAAANYRARIAKIFKQLDIAGDYEKLVEEELAHRKRKATAEAASPAAAAAPAATAAAVNPTSGELAPTEDHTPLPAHSPPPTPSLRTCPACSTINDPDAEFCKKCGKKFEAAS